MDRTRQVSSRRRRTASTPRRALSGSGGTGGRLWTASSPSRSRLLRARLAPRNPHHAALSVCRSTWERTSAVQQIVVAEGLEKRIEVRLGAASVEAEAFFELSYESVARGPLDQRLPDGRPGLVDAQVRRRSKVECDDLALHLLPLEHACTQLQRLAHPSTLRRARRHAIRSVLGEGPGAPGTAERDVE